MCRRPRSGQSRARARSGTFAVDPRATTSGSKKSSSVETAASLDLARQDLDRRAADRLDRLPDSGQRRIGAAHERRVVVADHREIGRNGETGPACRPDRAERERIARADDPGRAARDQAPRRSMAAFERETRSLDQLLRQPLAGGASDLAPRTPRACAAKGRGRAAPGSARSARGAGTRDGRRPAPSRPRRRSTRAENRGARPRRSRGRPEGGAEAVAGSARAARRPLRTARRRRSSPTPAARAASPRTRPRTCSRSSCTAPR